MQINPAIGSQVIQQLMQTQPRTGLSAGLGGLASIIQALASTKQYDKQQADSKASIESLMSALQGPPTAYATGADAAGPPAPRDAVAFGAPDRNKVLAAALAASQHNPQIAGLLPALLGGQGGEGFTLSEGQTRFDAAGNPMASAPKKTKPPETRTYQVGEENVTEQFDEATGSWKEIGRGSRVNKQEVLTGELGKKTGENLQEKFFNAQEGLGRLKAIGETFRPEFLTLGGRASALKTKWKDFAGMELDQGEKKYLTDYTTFTANAYDNLNRYIKEITGAAMTNAEAGRITKSLPNPESDGPQEFQAKYNATITQLQRAVARTRYALTTKQPIETYSIDNIDQIMDERGMQIEKQLIDSGLSPQQAEAQAMKQVKQEFGL